MERNYRKRMGNGYGGSAVGRGRARSGVGWLEGVKVTSTRLRKAMQEVPKVGEFVWYTSSKVLPRLLGGVISESWSRWVFSSSHGGFLWLAEEPSSLDRMLDWLPGDWAQDDMTNPVPGYASVFYLARGGKRIRVRVPDSAIKRAPAAEAPAVPAAQEVPAAQVNAYADREELRKRVLAVFAGRSISPEQNRTLAEWLKLASDGEIKEWLAKAEGAK